MIHRVALKVVLLAPLPESTVALGEAMTRLDENFFEVRIENENGLPEMLPGSIWKSESSHQSQINLKFSTLLGMVESFDIYATGLDQNKLEQLVFDLSHYLPQELNSDDK